MFKSHLIPPRKTSLIFVCIQGHDTVRPDKALLPTKFAGQGKQGPASVEKRPCLLPLSALHRDLPVLRSPIRGEYFRETPWNFNTVEVMSLANCC